MKILKLKKYHHEDDFSIQYVNLTCLENMSFYQGCNHMTIKTKTSSIEGYSKQFDPHSFENFIISANVKIFTLEIEIVNTYV